MTDSTPKKKRRILLKATIALVLLIVLIVALLPTILSMGIVRGIARDAIASSVNGEFDIAAVKLGWFSDQRVEGVRMRDRDGSNAVDVTLTLRGGLLGLLMSGGTGGTDGLNMVVSGSITGTRNADGSFGLATLFKSDGSSSGSGGGGTGGSSQSGPVNAKATITIDTLTVAIKDLESQKRYAIDGLSGSATFDGGAGTLNAKLASATDMAGQKGSIDITVDAKGVSHQVDLAKLVIDAKVKAANLRVPAGDREADFKTIELAITSPGLAQSARVVATVEGTLDGTASTLAADVSVDALVNSAGAVAFRPANVRGTIDASNLPTSLLQPSLAATNVRLSEDLGAVIERLSVKIPGGGAPVAVELKAQKAMLAASAVVDPESGAVNNASFDGTVDVTPASLARLASAEVSAPVRLALRGRSLAFAATARDGAPALERLTGWVEVQPETPVVWLDRTKNIAAAAGPSTVIRFGRDDAASRFAAQVNAALALGSATEPPSAPAASNLTLGATVDPAITRIENATLSADLPLEPGFLVATTGQSFSKPVRLMPTVRDLDLALPYTGLGGIAVDAEVRVAGETALYVSQVNRDIALRDIALLLKSEDLTREIALALDGVVDTASIEVRQTIRSLPSDPSSIDPLAINTRGTTKLIGLSAASLIAWAPQQRTLIESAGIRDLSIDLANEPLPGKPGQRATLTLGGQPISGNIIAGVERDRASIDRLELAGTVARAMVLELQGSSEKPVTLAADAPFTLALARPTSFRFDELSAGGLPADLAARLTVSSLAVASAPGLSGPLTVQGLDTTVEVDPSATKATAKGSFSASGAGANERIEAVTFDLAWAKPAATDPPSLLSGASGSLRVAGVQVPWVEGLVGLAAGTVSNWTGDAGSLSLTMGRSGAEEVVTLEPSFPPNITEGSVTVRASGERVTASAAGLRVSVPPTTLERLSTKPAQAKDAPRFQFASGLSLALTDAKVELPKALANGLASEGDVLAGGSVQVALAIEPMTLRSVRPGMPLETLRVPALVASLRSTDLRQAITFEATQNEQAADGSFVRVQGGVSNLSDANGAFSADAATLDLDAEVRDLPTALVDLLAATDGSLGRALGDRITMTAKAKSLSAKSGQANLVVRSPFVELQVPQLTINSGGVARITDKNPLTATFALSPGIKDDLLYQINTIFADVELVKERATLTVRDLRYPLDGNLARFDSDLTLDVGDVRMRNGKPVSILFELLDNRPTPGSEARIEPLVVKINNGRLTYENFALRLFKQEGAPGTPPTWRSSIEMKGDVDLAKKHVNAITTRLPLSQVANYSGDATKILNQIGGRDSALAKSLSLGVTLYGPLYDDKGNFKELEMKLAPPEVGKDIKPEDLLKEGLKQIPGLVK